MRSYRFPGAKKIFGAGVFSFAILALWAFWWEPSHLTVVHQTVAISPWYPEHAGLRIAVISDLHVGSPHRGLSTLTDLVNTTNAEKPDLVVMLWDFVVRGVVGGHFVEPEQIAQQLAALHAPLGV